MRLFGTMDDEDRPDIDNHLNIIDENNHNLITSINRQVDITKNFTETFTNLKT